jgi:hypothetical protein
VLVAIAAALLSNGLAWLFMAVRDFTRASGEAEPWNGFVGPGEAARATGAPHFDAHVLPGKTVRR